MKKVRYKPRGLKTKIITLDLDSVLGVPSALLFIFVAGVNLTSPRPIISGLAAIPGKKKDIQVQQILLQLKDHS